MWKKSTLGDFFIRTSQKSLQEGGRVRIPEFPLYPRLNPYGYNHMPSYPIRVSGLLPYLDIIAYVACVPLTYIWPAEYPRQCRQHPWQTLAVSLATAPPHPPWSCGTHGAQSPSHKKVICVWRWRQVPGFNGGDEKGDRLWVSSPGWLVLVWLRPGGARPGPRAELMFPPPAPSTSLGVLEVCSSCSCSCKVCGLVYAVAEPPPGSHPLPARHTPSSYLHYSIAIGSSLVKTLFHFYN